MKLWKKGDIVIDKKLKTLIEENPVAVATTMPDGKPNVIAVAAVRVVGKNEILVTDNYMSQTLKDIANKPDVSIVVWDPKSLNGCKFVGIASYYNSGKWLDYVKSMPDNEGYPAKGAILVSVSKIIPVASEVK
jgi:uncharacterized protein